MRHKSESFEKFKEFKNEVENQLNKKIKVLRSDRGGEYLSHEFGDYLRECGIVTQLTPPGTPQWNGVSERRNRTLLDMVRSMMSQADLPISFWGLVLETAAFTLNRVPSKSVDKTPYEIWTGKVPNMSFIKIWGCEAYVKRLITTKLEPKSDKHIFVGYPKETKGYYFYNKEENKVVVARFGVFLEKDFLARGSERDVRLEEVQDTSQDVINDNIPMIIPRDVEASGSERDPPIQTVVEEVQTPTEETSNQLDVEQVVQEVEQQEPQPPVLRRSTRVRHEPERYMGLHETSVLDTDEPLTYTEAMDRPDSNDWLEAMKSEMQSMYDNQVWDLVDLSKDIKPINNR